MRRVVKIGGSLLLRPGLEQALHHWVRSQPPAQTIAIVGGGQLIDAMRRLDEVHQCPPDWIHWECVRLLGTTFRWLAGRMDDWESVPDESTFRDLIALPRGDSASERVFLVDVNAFYREGIPTPLPESWATTTDAIAAWLAESIDADELVLMKSCEVDSAISLDELSRGGIVDEAILQIPSRNVPLRFVNLAAELERETPGL